MVTYNNILYTGGLINKSAKLDILCAIVYLAVLLAVIKPIQVYAIPFATLVVSILFISWYLKLMQKHLGLNVRILVVEFAKSMILILPFVTIHYILNLDYHNLYVYGAYFIVFSALFVSVLLVTNKPFFLLLQSKLKK